MLRRGSGANFRYRQRGAFGLITAGTLALLLVSLSLTLDSGRLYMEQRRLQKVADLSAQETISRLGNGNCIEAGSEEEPATNHQSLAEESAERNNFILSDSKFLTAECVDLITVEGIREAKPAANSNAVRVIAKHVVPTSLILKAGSIFNSDITANTTLQAIASAERSGSVAAFSVGPELSRLNPDAALGRLLESAGLGIDTLEVLNSEGLTNASITPSGLLEALGIDDTDIGVLTPEKLVELANSAAADDLAGIGGLLGLLSSASSSSEAQGAISELLNEVIGVLDTPLDIQLFGLDDEKALINISSALEDSKALLETEVNLGELLAVGLYAGMEGKSLVIDGLDLLGINVEAGIVEPPSIGVGPVGTTAYSAQVRLHIDIDTNTVIGGLLAWLLNDVLGTRIHLPIWIDLVSSQGILTDIDCNTPSPTASIDETSRLLNMCVGEISPEHQGSTSQSCEINLEETELVRLLGAPILSGKTHTPVGLYSLPVSLTHLEKGESKYAEPELNLDSTIEGLVNGLLDLLSGLFREPIQSQGNEELEYHAPSGQVAALANQYLEASKDTSGFYNVTAINKLILYGSDELDETGNQILAPLVEQDWHIDNIIPKNCLITVCPQSQWDGALFSEAFVHYNSIPSSLLDLLGISTLPNGYRSCSGLLSALLDWNGCLEHNLTKFLEDKPGGINLSQIQDGSNLANSSNENIACTGALCILLKPILEILKPTLMGLSELLNATLDDVLGIELGRTEVKVNDISCNAPALVR